MALTGVETKVVLPEWIVQIIAKESDRLLVKPDSVLIMWLDAYARERGLVK